MYSFRNDYGEGAHPRILEALIKTNLYQTPGYGEDEYTYKAIEILKAEVGNQLFPIFPNEVIDKIREEYAFEEQMIMDESNTCIRFVTSWATEEKEVILFLAFLKDIS